MFGLKPGLQSAVCRLLQTQRRRRYSVLRLLISSCVIYIYHGTAMFVCPAGSDSTFHQDPNPAERGGEKIGLFNSSVVLLNQQRFLLPSAVLLFKPKLSLLVNRSRFFKIQSCKSITITAMLCLLLSWVCSRFH